MKRPEVKQAQRRLYIFCIIAIVVISLTISGISKLIRFALGA